MYIYTVAKLLVLHMSTKIKKNQKKKHYIWTCKPAKYESVHHHLSICSRSADKPFYSPETQLIFSTSRGEPVFAAKHP